MVPRQAVSPSLSKPCELPNRKKSHWVLVIWSMMIPASVSLLTVAVSYPLFHRERPDLLTTS